MKLNTMAAVMSFVSKIENDSASFYRNYAEKYPELESIFLSWNKENSKFEKNDLDSLGVNGSSCKGNECERGIAFSCSSHAAS